MFTRTVRTLIVIVLLVVVVASMRVGASQASDSMMPPAQPVLSDSRADAVLRAGLARSQDRVLATAETPVPSVAAALLGELQAQVGGTAGVAYHAYTGKVRFLSTQAGQPIPRAAGLPSDADPKPQHGHF